MIAVRTSSLFPNQTVFTDESDEILNRIYGYHSHLIPSCILFAYMPTLPGERKSELDPSRSEVSRNMRNLYRMNRERKDRGKNNRQGV